MKEATELLTAEELAKRLRVTTETIRLWTRRGLIPSLRPTPKVIRYNADAVMQALSATTVGRVPHAK
jgi:excisionase family DNA binding protein